MNRLCGHSVAGAQGLAVGRGVKWLRFALAVLVLSAFFPSSASSASLRLFWEPSPDSNVVGYAVYYGSVGTLTTNRSDAGNTTNALVSSLQPGWTYFFYVTACDSVRNESDPSNVINYTVPSSTNSNTVPSLGTLANQSVTATSNLTFTATATDADLPAQTLTFSLGTGAPTGASINSSSGVFSWTPTAIQVGSYSVTVRVTDNGSPALSASQTLSITVTASPNTAPSLGTLANQSVTATSNLTFTATATDVDLPAQTLSFSLGTGAPTGASINPATGVFSWTPTRSQTGNFSVSVRVTDNGSPALSATGLVSITVTAPPNTAPALGTLANQSVTATSNLTFTATATDVDVPAQTLTFSLGTGAPTGASINPATGVFSWTPTAIQVGSYSVTVRVTDNGSPALSATRTISITSPPHPTPPRRWARWPIRRLWPPATSPSPPPPPTWTCPPRLFPSASGRARQRELRSIRLRGCSPGRRPRSRWAVTLSLSGSPTTGHLRSQPPGPFRFRSPLHPTPPRP